MKLQMKPITLLISFLIFGALIFGIESTLKGSGNGSLILVLSFFVALAEGSIALAAIGEITKAKWLLPIKKELLSTYPLLLFFSFLFLLFNFNMAIYPWTVEEGFWLNKQFFMARNFLFLILTYLLARKFASESTRESKNKNTYAVFYLLIFAVSQSLVAFDWVMSLAYPWISTLFGGYFFVEAIYSVIALAGIFYFLLYRNSPKEAFSEIEPKLKDISTLLFGFSLLWVGLFYAQFLVIWYGNIPEETSFIIERISKSPFIELSYLVLLILFLIPFVVLISMKVKVNPYIIFPLSIMVLSGIFAERFLMIAPIISLNPYALIIEFLGIAFLFGLLVLNRENILFPHKTER